MSHQQLRPYWDMILVLKSQEKLERPRHKPIAPGSELIKLFSCSAKMKLKFILLMNVNCWHFNINEQDKLLDLRI